MNCADISLTEHRGNIARFISKREADGYPFFCYRLPGQTTVCYGAAASVERGLHTGAFIVAPFAEPIENVESIIPQEDIELTSPPASAPIALFPEEPTDREAHREGVDTIRTRLRALGAGKCVLSRVITGTRSQSLADSFLNICDCRKDAYVFIFRTPKAGTWLGASPELLLEGKRGEIRTMALAGTRPIGSPNEWDAKNIEEQQLVTAHIVNVMEHNGMTAIVSPLHTRAAGVVEHLCNEISASVSLDCSQLASFLSELSPTPALAGSPREEAMQLIKLCEKHQRGHYGGFAGPYHSAEDFRFFVNLRSARIEGERFAQFCGGGITRFSDADEEWFETERKAATLPPL